MYYINDGVYGSFNCVLYDHYVPEPYFVSQVRAKFASANENDIIDLFSLFIISKNDSHEKHTSSIWGPTCDGLDCIHSSIEMPQMSISDWMIWKNMGAYTISAAVEFNGLPFGKPIYFMSKPFWFVFDDRSNSSDTGHL